MQSCREDIKLLGVCGQRVVWTKDNGFQKRRRLEEYIGVNFSILV